MGFKSDIEIAQETVMEPISRIAEAAGINTQGRGIIFSLPVDHAMGLAKAIIPEEK